MKRRLHELAHARAGDKGDTLTLSVFALREADYPLLIEQVTPAAVKRHLAHIVKGELRRYELLNIHALQFVCERALGTGVTTALALDPHGKSLSYALLELSVDTVSQRVAPPLRQSPGTRGTPSRRHRGLIHAGFALMQILAPGAPPLGRSFRACDPPAQTSPPTAWRHVDPLPVLRGEEDHPNVD